VDDRYSTAGSGSSGESQDPATQRLQDATAGLVDQAREAAVTQANTGVEAATDRLQHVAHAVRKTSQSLREQDQPQIAMLADRTAEQVEKASGYFAGKDVRDLVGEVERFARREPAVFLAGGLTIGLLAARFLKSSPPSQPIPAERAVQTYEAPRMGYADTGTIGDAYAGSGYAGSGYASGSTGYVGVMSDDTSGSGANSGYDAGYAGYGGTTAGDYDAGGTTSDQSEMERYTGVSSQSGNG
jgi:hypothetical protein